ncbi:formate dehydrogenase subunit gamma [Streptomyces sp. NPDC001292]|uniref:formate dehydrogenase subunit gamma n=1 Tax=Streptomyces sp. NPDC001292 TaxID=3364558 RepID=UPI00369513CC
MNGDQAEQAEVVRAVVVEHRHQPGPLLEILREIQERLGYVDPDVVPVLAAELNLSRAEVHGVLTFYSDFRSTPPGATSIRLCRAEACQSVGAERLIARTERLLGVKVGGTTPDGAVTLEQVYCLGNCALGPAAQVNGKTVGRLDEQRLDSMLRAARPAPRAAGGAA